MNRERRVTREWTSRACSSFCTLDTQQIISYSLSPPQCTLSRAITANEALASCDGVSSGLSRRRLHRAARALTGILKSNYLQLEAKKNDVLGCTARTQPEHTAIL